MKVSPHPISTEVVKELKQIVGEEWVVTKKELTSSYLYDQTPEPVRPTASDNVIVVKPKDAKSVSQILIMANKHKIPVFPRGGGTGLVGGCIPTASGIVLSLERMKNISIDRENLFAEVEAGVTLGELIEAVEKVGLFFPPHPGDEGAQLGGLIACNAGGARAVKTGVMRNYVKGVEVVLPTGEILTLGGKLLKNNLGYDLMQLIIGSEGTLGIITKAWVRLSPKQLFYATLIIPFNHREKALKIAPKILQSGISPLAIEYVERELVEQTAKELNLNWPCGEGLHQLIIILEESSEEALLQHCEKLLTLSKEYEALEPIIAERSEEQKQILKIRSEIGLILLKDTIDILDISVPPSALSSLIEEAEKLAQMIGLKIALLGHAGDGNIHLHILKTEGSNIQKRYEEYKTKIYQKAIEFGGTITGEHGIGCIKKPYFVQFVDENTLKVMKAIKRLFDPNNILNPGKILP